MDYIRFYVDKIKMLKDLHLAFFGEEDMYCPMCEKHFKFCECTDEDAFGPYVETMK